MSKFVESIARTNKLYCSSCHEKIKKGDDVVFELDEGRMKNVYGEKCGCKVYYEDDVLNDMEHPFSSEALGQE